MKINYIKLRLFKWLVAAILCSISPSLMAVQLSGTYTIDSTQAASTTNFRNLTSAVIYLTSASARTDGGPANSAPFGVSGPVIFNFTGNITTYIDQVTIPAITGVSATNTVTINGNGRTIQFACNVNNYAVLRLSGADYVRINNLTIRSTDATYGWGIHFYLGADYNIIDSCNIEIVNVTSTSSTNSAGIVFSNSLTSPTTSGANGYFNIVRNCNIKGNPTGAGMYYGIVGFPASSSTTLSNNQFVNNIIDNFYIYGIYWGNGNRTVFRGNRITRTTKTTVSTTYGFYFTSSSRADTIDANIITNLFAGTPTNTSTVYGIYGINYSGLSTEPNSFTNNLMYDFKGNGSQFGFYFLTAFNNRFYNNTVSFDYTASTSTGTTYGFYWSGNTSATSFLDFRNNIIYITRGGTGQKCAMFTTGAWTTGATLGKNGYYGNASNYVMMNYLGLNYATYNDWRNFISVTDQTSSDFAPAFVNISTGNLSPQDGWYAAKGDSISYVVRDVNGQARTFPLDIGAVNSSAIQLDVAMQDISTPATPYTAGLYPINCRIRNSGLTTITSATINWTLNGVAQTPVAFNGNLAGGATSANILLSNVQIQAGIMYDIVVTVSNPNNGTDGLVDNNTVSSRTACSLSGTVTINKNLPASATNFIGLSNLADLISLGGISGPLTVNVAPNSGPYTEQVFFTNVKGANGLNQITVNGNGQYIQFNNTDATRIGIINIIGTDFMTFNNLNVRSQNASYGIGYLLTLGSDTNTINGCTIDISSVTGSSLSAGIAITGALNSPTSSVANNGFMNKITNNNIVGGSTGGPYYGITVIPHNTNSTTFNSGTIVENNTIADPTLYGIYATYISGSRFSRNTIHRLTKSSPSTFYGIYIVNGSNADTVELNIIKDPYAQVPTSTGTGYGIAFATPNTPSNRPNTVRNNLIYNIRSNGTFYGIYHSTTNNIRIYHNTVVIDNVTATAGTQYCFYHTGTPTSVEVRNNLFYMRRQGGTNYNIYLNTTGTGYIINNNAYYNPFLGGTNYTGYYSTALTTMANWQTANSNAYDQQGVFADPKFRTFVNPEFFQPGTDSLDNKGANVLSVVPTDFVGSARTTTPDIGAYEFIAPAVDAGLTRFTTPTNPLSLGFQNVAVVIKNFGSAPLFSASLGWSVNDTVQSPNFWTGSLNANDTAVFNLGNYNFAYSGFHSLKAWTSSPNSGTDSVAINDTIRLTVCTAFSGNFTINSALPSSTTNFTSLSSFVSALNNCGVNGPVTATLANGTYQGPVTFIGQIPGASFNNKVTIQGTDSALTILSHDGSGQRATIQLNGTKHLVFRNLTVLNTGASSGFGILLTQAADSNRFSRLTVRTTEGVSTTALAGIVSSNSVTAVNSAGNNASYITIDSCTILGGYYGINLYNSSAPRALGNKVLRNKIINAYYYGVWYYYQNESDITGNIITNTGVGINTFASPIYAYFCDNGIRITKNEITGSLGGYGIYMNSCYGTSTNRNIVANNAVQLGALTYTSYGIYDINNAYNDVMHNTVVNNSGDASYVSCAYYYNYNNSALYNNLRVYNNVFTAPNGAMASWCAQNANIALSSISMNNNVYYSPSSYPWRILNTIYPNLASYQNGINTWNPTVPPVDTFSYFFQPSYISPTNLRSITPQLDSIGAPFATVPDDIDGNSRSVNAPDAGIYEFNKPQDDAGVTDIILPTKPLQPGLSDIKVIIRNFGVSNLTSANVSYRIDTVLRTTAWTGNIAPGNSDTVTFNATSGPGGTSQRYNFTGALVNIKAYTSMPNNVNDIQNLNDTATTSICGGLSGTYTIDPNGSGSNNFTSFAAAIDKLNCGGVFGPVVFNIANGTYNGQIDITAVAGSSSQNTIVFKSASNNSANVILTSNNSTTSNNFTLRLNGASFMQFRDLTIRNTNATFARVVSFNKLSAQNLNTNNIEFRSCILEGITTTSTADQYSVVFGPGGDNATNLRIVGCQVKNGSYGVYIGGQNIINLFSPGLEIDSNVFENQYWAQVYLLNRNEPKVRNNTFNGLPTYGYYTVFMSSVSGNLEISNNVMQNYNGVYGIYITQCNYYGETGLAMIRNNAVNMMSTGTQYGIYLANASNLYTYNNTVRCQSTSTGTYAWYFSGNTTSPTVPQIVQSNNLHLVNNILWSATGYSVYYANNFASGAMTNVNHNLYYTGGINFSYNLVNIPVQNPLLSYRNSIHPGSDVRSIFGNIVFGSATNAKPLESNSSVWLSNGRGVQTGFVNNDLAGLTRSTVVLTGAPDIGAYEVVPTATPVSLVLTDSIYWGSTQRIIEFGDTIGTITWGFSGFLPTALDVKYFPGTLISDPTNNGTTTNAQFMDAFWRITPTGGISYSYDISLSFNPTQLGKVPNESDLRLARKYSSNPGTWTHYASVLTNLDTINNLFGSNTLTEFGDFTGTTDISPLPVKLASFNAKKSQLNAVLNWTTASERNVHSFEIERTDASRNFIKIGVVKATGNSNELVNYDFTDINAANLIKGNTAYYRLKMIDADGSFEYSDTRLVVFNQLEPKNTMVAYPNPFSGLVNINLNSTSDQISEVMCFDLTGKLISKQSYSLKLGENKISLDALNAAEAGVYLIQVKIGDEVLAEKLIKE